MDARQHRCDLAMGRMGLRARRRHRIGALPGTGWVWSSRSVLAVKANVMEVREFGYGEPSFLRRLLFFLPG